MFARVATAPEPCPAKRLLTIRLILSCAGSVLLPIQPL
jgi:hypothetical protein